MCSREKLLIWRDRDTPIDPNEEHSTDCYWVKRDNGIIINTAVKEKISRIQDQKAFPELSVAIKALMALVERCLHIDTRKRPRARQLCQEFEVIYEQIISATSGSKSGTRSRVATRLAASLTVPKIGR
jgi:hypothetical protein